MVRFETCSLSFTINPTFAQGDRVLDAVRDSDGQTVVIKRISRSIHPHEISIGQFLSSPPLSSDSRNHCCPILDVLDDPMDTDMQLMVMPLLRIYDDPRMNTVGEAIAFLRQAFEVRVRDVFAMWLLLIECHTGPTIYARAPCCSSVCLHVIIITISFHADTRDQRLHVTQHNVRSSRHVSPVVSPCLY